MVRTAIFLLALLPAAMPQEANGVKALQGTWGMITSKGFLYEEWAPSPTVILAGKSYRLNGQDSVILESLQIARRADGIYYESLVTGQNQGRTVGFKLVLSEAGQFQFENPQHDYPQRIIYRFVSADSVVARIEGTQDGKTRGSDFYYKRIR
jgi:hypothetical protein